ncbi:predicted protein [Histoplasma capsulatum H143]|uniref:Uncharacterized protein n=1 Tax=Ajellomyces capsulatus (strain H143) TaxID=544712 RepID=C6HEN6_AJECH|nr:predicted protein [Histoplasma capsulatum H143]
MNKATPCWVARKGPGKAKTSTVEAQEDDRGNAHEQSYFLWDNLLRGHSQIIATNKPRKHVSTNNTLRGTNLAVPIPSILHIHDIVIAHDSSFVVVPPELPRHHAAGVLSLYLLVTREIIISMASRGLVPRYS